MTTVTLPDGSRQSLLVKQFSAAASVGDFVSVGATVYQLRGSFGNRKPQAWLIGRIAGGAS